MDVVVLENVYKEYGFDENKVKAIQGVSLSIKKGEFVAIIGKSGSGKSTLLKMVGAMEKPTEGSITVGGINISDLKSNKLAVFRRRSIGFVFQDYSLISVLNAYDNVSFPMILDKGHKQDKQRVKKLMEELGIWNKKDKFPDELSGGQKQRVAIARALINEPDIILADEPTGNLDSQNALEVITMLKNCCKAHGQTTLMVTHDEELAQICDRIIRVSDGKIYEE